MTEGAALREALVRSLGPWASAAGAITGVLRLSWDRLEASLRGGTGPLRGERMMLERLGADEARALLEALPPKLGPSAQRMLALARREGMGLIGGWDAAAGVSKLYLNASDASAALRRRLAQALGAPEAPPPHVLGLNLATGAEELKAYVQSPGMPPGAPACLRRLVPGEAVAGGVESWVRRAGRWTRRASFVALRPGAALALSELPGWDEERAARCAPFPPGAPTSVGVDAVGRAWTLYFRARGAGAPQWRLEPVAVFRCPEGEVGIYVAPAAAAERAYLRTGPHALSYRIREGTVAGPRVDALMQWAAGALSPDGRRIRGEPPSPWARY